jgi:hypothetical protein
MPAKLSNADPRNKNAITARSPQPRKCTLCGCTEQRACVIQVAIAADDGSSRVVISRGCAWSQLNPDHCTACEALRGGNEYETDILMDLFPQEFAFAQSGTARIG